MFLIWLPFEVAGQNEIWTIADCMTKAKENDFGFKIQALKIKQATKNKTSLASRFLPQIDANFNHQYNFGSAIDPNTNSRVSANFQYDNLGVNAQINLFNFSEIWQSRLEAKGLDIERAQGLLIEQEYMMTLVEKFYAAYGTQEWLKIMRQQFKNTELQVDRITKEVESGLKPESDIYDIQVVYTQEKKTLFALEQEEINKKTELLQWINMQHTNPYNINLIQENTNPILDEQINSNQNVKIALEQQKKQRLEYENKQLLHSFLPRVTLGYSYGSFYSRQIVDLSNTSFDFGNQLKNNKSQYLGLGIQIPIFSRGDNARLRTIKKLQINEQNLQIEKSEMEQRNVYANYYRKLQQYYNLSPILKEALYYAEKSLTTTQDKYTFGKVDISAYKAAKNQVLSSSSDIINNKLSIYMSERLLMLLK